MEHIAFIDWKRDGALFIDKKYSREHKWAFDGGLSIPASASPHIVNVPFSNPANLDPEEAFVASLASCHMLWFLSIAAENRYTVDSYSDQAVGILEKNSEGALLMTKIFLHPRIIFAGTNFPDEEAKAEMHHQAHEKCFLANSVKTEIVVE